MKNREKLSNIAIYDLLRKIESYINDEFTAARVSDRIFCIQEVFDGRFTVINELGYKQHVCPHEDLGFITSHDCQNCLNNWLNEEVYDNE
jgi:hypothetical protein